MDKIIYVDTTLLQVKSQLGDDNLLLKDLDNIESRYDTSLLDPVPPATPSQPSQVTASKQITLRYQQHKRDTPKTKRAPDIFASREFAA